MTRYVLISLLQSTRLGPFRSALRVLLEARFSLCALIFNVRVRLGEILLGKFFAHEEKFARAARDRNEFRARSVSRDTR